MAYCVRRPSARGSEPRLHEPVVQAERVHRDRVERSGLGHERVANEREHSTAKKRLISAVVHCAVYPNTHGPVTRRARCRAGSERVQRDRVETFGLCHAWVANESRSDPKPRRVVRMLSFGDQQWNWRWGLLRSLQGSDVVHSPSRENDRTLYPNSEDMLG